MKYGENYYFIYPDGEVLSAIWRNSPMDNGMYNQNNVFKTRREAWFESKRRALVTKIQRFRDECNEGKQLDWDNENQAKFYIGYDNLLGECYVTCNRVLNNFVPFGYFANHHDAELVLREYGSEIKKLFIEVEKCIKNY